MKTAVERGWGRASTLVLAVLVVACQPDAQQIALRAEERRIECLDKICEGDVAPKVNVDQFAMKLGGQWFVGPREYGGYGGALAFYWPSKTPKGGRPDRAQYPERGSDFYDVAIEIFLRSNNIPPEPWGYRFIELAQANNWIASRKMLRPGLEAVQMKHVIGPQGYSIDHVTYYVATELRGVDGLPPIATCDNLRPDSTGGTGFMWRPGIWVGTRMNQKYCVDWPEIYLETVRVLQLFEGK